MGHILERALRNIMQGLHRRRGTNAFADVAEQVFAGLGHGNVTRADTYHYNDGGVFGGNSGVRGNLKPGYNSGVRGNASPEYTHLDEDDVSRTDTDTISYSGDR